MQHYSVQLVEKDKNEEQKDERFLVKGKSMKSKGSKS